MDKKRVIAGLITIFLATCVTKSPISKVTEAPTQTAAIVQTQLPILPLSNTPSYIFTPSLAPTPTPTSLPKTHLQAGEKYLFDGDYLNALTEFQAALTNATDQETKADALWGTARVEYITKNPGKALTDLGDLAKLSPGTTYAARAYFLMGEIYMAVERYSEAAHAYEEYLTLRPGILDSFVQERHGDAANSAGLFNEAISAYKNALAAPHIGDDITIQIKLAQAYVSSGDTTSAMDLYESISKGSSNDFTKAQMDLLIGRLDLSLGQTDQANQHFLDAVNNYPMSYDAYSALVALVNANVQVDDLNRGLTDYFAGQYGFARDAFQRYIFANPKNDGTALYYYALTLLKLGNTQEGIDELTTFIIRYPGNKNWQSAWGIKADTQWAALSDNDAAAQTYLDFTKAVRDNILSPQALYNAGRNYERANQLEQAAKTWESIAISYPGSDLVPQALFDAGIALYRAKKYDQALVTLQRDLQFSTSPDDQARAYFWIGKTQQEAGNATSAQTAWQQATSLSPTGYYSLRSEDMLLNRPVFTPPSTTSFPLDLAEERTQAEAWLRVTFNLPIDTDLSNPGTLIDDPRMVRGTELWYLGLKDEARGEFEDLLNAIKQNPADTYRLANYLLDLGLYRQAITAIRQVLTLAGMASQSQTLAASAYFNHIRYGLYFQELVIPAAQQAGFDPLFLFSVMREESLFEGFVQSTKGARGLMQIIPDTGKDVSGSLKWPPDYTSEDLYRPNVSITFGATYLQLQRLQFDNDLFTALAAYNAGPSSAKIWQDLSGPDPDLFLETIRIDDTRNYIIDIYENYCMYRYLYGITP